MTETAKNSRQSIPYGRKFANATKMAENEPTLSGFYTPQCEFRAARNGVHRICQKTGQLEIGARSLCEVFEKAFSDNKAVGEAMRPILSRILTATGLPQLSRSGALRWGFSLLQTYRAANWLVVRITAWRYVCKIAPQKYFRLIFIRPLSHRQGRVYRPYHRRGDWRNAVVGDDVSMLLCVTLQAAAAKKAVIAAKIGDGVLISVGAKVLGYVRVGDCAKIGGGQWC